MLKVIDLDQQGKDVDGFVFTLTLGDARYGVTDQEVIELIKTKYASAKSGAKKATPRRNQPADTSSLETTSSEAMPEAHTGSEVGEASH